MKKLFNLLKKHVLSIFIGILIVIIGIAVFIFKNYDTVSLKELKTKNYELKYNKSWKLKNNLENEILFKHNKNASLKIEIVNIEEYIYFQVDDLIDEIIYKIKKQNDDYKLIYKEKALITNLELNGYKMLYENDESELLIVIYKQGDKLIVFEYESLCDYFDILLDSVNNIIYSFKYIEEKYDISSTLKILTSNLEFEENSVLDSKIKEVSNYTIASNNYIVDYSIPNIFELTEINSKYNYFDTDDISISTNILNKNLYEYLDKDNNGSVFNNYDLYKEDEKYTNFKEIISKITDEYYIYKNSYNYTDKYNENIIIIYALDKNHIFIVKISSNIKITKKLIDNISINKYENYSSYIKSATIDKNIISELKKYRSYNDKTIENVIISIPNKYREIDKFANIYLDRYYGLNYNKNKELYDYEIHYSLTENDKNSIINNINSLFINSYNKSDALTKTDELIINNKKFEIYTGGYTNISGIMYTSYNKEYYVNKKILLYSISKTENLVIEISGNDNEITNEIIREVTNFEIK